MLEPLFSHTGILMSFYLSIILHFQNFFHWYILQSWKLKETTDTASFASFLDLYLEFDDSGQLSTKIYVYFQGQMSSDFLQDLICTCKGKAVCSSGCVLFEQGLPCTDLCPCQAGEICRNSNTQISRNKSIDDDDVDLLQLDVQEWNC